MVHKKLVLLAVAALMSPASANQARSSGLAATHDSLAAAHVHGVNGGFARGPAAFGRPYGPFVPPFAPISAFYAYGPSYPSCWTWLPARFGWRRTWVCNWPYGLGYGYY
jgi:hypothetical protein